VDKLKDALRSNVPVYVGLGQKSKYTMTWIMPRRDLVTFDEHDMKQFASIMFGTSLQEIHACFPLTDDGFLDLGKFKKWYGNFVIVGKTSNDDFEDLSRFGIFRKRTEHEMFFRSLLGENFGKFARRSAAKAKAKAKAKGVLKMKTKRKADFQRAGSILLSGKAPALQTEDPDEDLHVDNSAGDTAMDVQCDEVVVGILQCAQCRTNRHVSADMLSFTLIALEFLNVIALARAAGSFAAGRFLENLCMFLRAANSKELCDCMCLLACWLGWCACLSACFWWSGCSCWFAWSALSGWAGSMFISK
jgi:hypothetical protein